MNPICPLWSYGLMAALQHWLFFILTVSSKLVEGLLLLSSYKAVFHTVCKEIVYIIYVRLCNTVSVGIIWYLDLALLAHLCYYFHLLLSQ